MMTNFLKFCLVSLFAFLLSGCPSSDDTNDIPENTSVVGKWQLVEHFLSPGGPGYWNPVENGTTFEFKADGTFTSSQHEECTTGTYSTEDNKLSLHYNCEGFTPEIVNDEGNFVYRFLLTSGYLELTPQTVICIEGCTYRYEKISAGK